MPGDKSISHRGAMIAALANGVSRIANFSTSADCMATLSCLRQLGVQIEEADAEVIVHGVGRDGLRAPDAPLDCRNSGTTLRLLAGILAGQDFISTLTGDASLRSRPMKRIIAPLEMMGARISSHDGQAPLKIQGRQRLRAIDYELLVASAQVKSCILLAGLNAEGQTTVIENEPTRDHTERMLRWFGSTVEIGGAEPDPEHAGFARVTGPARLQARDVSIPGDISSAAYFIAAAALLSGSSLQVGDTGVNPTRVAFVETLHLLGLDITIKDVREESNEPAGIIRVRGRAVQTVSHREEPFIVDGSAIARLIDELPLLAVVGSQLSGGIEIRDAKELRVKESDRIAATVEGLRRMGAQVEEFEDGLRVEGSVKLRGAKIDPRGDHRIAMAFTVAALLANGETEIEDADCVAVSFPEFFEVLETVVETASPSPRGRREDEFK